MARKALPKRNTPPKQLKKRHFLPFAAALFISIYTISSTLLKHDTWALPNPPAGKEWNLIFSDEFNGSSVDTSKWNVQHNSNFGANNYEDQCYVSSGSTVSGGTLNLTATRQVAPYACGSSTNPNGSGNGYHFTSGMVTTRAQQGAAKFKFNKGYVEARIKMPSGNPYWGAFWLVSSLDDSAPIWPDYGEIDITELVGGRPDLSHMNFWYKCGSSACNLNGYNRYNLGTGTMDLGTKLDISNFGSYTGSTASGFHTYGVWWEANKLSYYVDGQLIGDFDGTTVRRYKNGVKISEGTRSTPNGGLSTPLGYDRSIILNLAVGGKFPADFPANATSNIGTSATYGYSGEECGAVYCDNFNANTGFSYAANTTGSMQVDYVHVYQLKDSAVTTPPPTTSPTTPSTPGGSGTNPSASARTPSSPSSQTASSPQSTQANNATSSPVDTPKPKNSVEAVEQKIAYIRAKPRLQLLVFGVSGMLLTLAGLFIVPKSRHIINLYLRKYIRHTS